MPKHALFVFVVRKPVHTLELRAPIYHDRVRIIPMDYRDRSPIRRLKSRLLSSRRNVEWRLAVRVVYPGVVDGSIARREPECD